MTSSDPPLLVREPTLPATARPRLEFIDALRAIACLSVLLHHSFEDHPTHRTFMGSAYRFFVAVSDFGYLGVGLFLVLSGFCLYYPIARRTAPGGAGVDIRQFAGRRMRRILPPYYTALALSVALAFYRAHHHHQPLMSAFAAWYDVPAHLLMLHNLSVPTFASLNGPFWTLALESQFYVMFPAFVWLAARRGFGVLALVTGSIALVWQTLAFLRFGPCFRWDTAQVIWYSAPVARCFEFVLGMWAAELLNRPAPRQIAIATTLIIILPPIGIAYELAVSHYGPLHDQIWGILFAASVVLLGSLPGARLHNQGWLRALAVLGTFSYSIYLIHVPLISLFYEGSLHLMPLTASEGGYVAFGLARMLLICGFAYLFFLVAERPFLAGSVASRAKRGAVG